mgnify:FL=1
MTQWLIKAATATVKLGPFVDSVDGVTAETGLSIAQADIRLSKNGGDYAQTNNAAGATHDESGYYDVPLNATDTNTLGRLRVSVSKTGALPVWQDFMVVTADMGTELHKCKAVLANIVKQTIATGVVVVYDDDGATPLITLTPSVDSTSAPTKNIVTPT